MLGNRIRFLVGSVQRSFSSQVTEWMPFQKKEFIRRRGHQPPFHQSGLLPRLVGDKGPLRILQQPREDPWCKKQALFGQNDYIDILGEGNIHPTRLMTNVPEYLRGFKGHEIEMLNRKRHVFPHWKNQRPVAYHQLKDRIARLYAFLNIRKRPPPIEQYD